MTLTDKEKDELGEVVAGTLKDVLIPSLERMHNRMGSLEESVEGLKDTVERIDRRTERMEDKFEDHEERLVRPSRPETAFVV